MMWIIWGYGGSHVDVGFIRGRNGLLKCVAHVRKYWHTEIWSSYSKVLWWLTGECHWLLWRCGLIGDVVAHMRYGGSYQGVWTQMELWELFAHIILLYRYFPSLLNVL